MNHTNAHRFPRRTLLQGALAGLTGTLFGRFRLSGSGWAADALDMPVVLVTDPAFGATGDGVTDDRAAFQAAIDTAVAQQRPLLVPPPAVAYQIEIDDEHDALYIEGDLVLIGGGAADTALRFNVAEPDLARRYAGITIRNGANVTLRDLRVVEAIPNPALEFYGILFEAGPEDHVGVVTRVDVEGFHHCIHVPSGSVEAVGELDLTLMGCDLRPGLMYGLSFWTAPDGHKRLKMVNCYVHDNSESHLVYCHPHNTVFVKGCRFERATAWAWQFQGSAVGSAPEYQRFEDCWFGPDNSRGIITQSPGTVEIRNCVFRCRPAVQMRSDTIVEQCVFTTETGIDKASTFVSAYGESPWRATLRDCVFAPFAPSIPQVDLRLPNIDVTVERCLFYNQNVSHSLLALGGNRSRFEVADCVFRNDRTAYDDEAKTIAVYMQDGQVLIRDSRFEGPFMDGNGIFLCEANESGPTAEARLEIANCTVNVAGSDPVFRTRDLGANTWNDKISGRETFILNLQPPHQVFDSEPSGVRIAGALEPAVGESPVPLLGAPIVVVNSNYDAYAVSGSARIEAIHWWEPDGGSDALFGGRVRLSADQGFQLAAGGNIRLPDGDVNVAAGQDVTLAYDSAIGAWQVVE